MSKIKINSTKVCGIDEAVRAMRNPYDSWGKSDTVLDSGLLGTKDLILAKSLIKQGPSHRKFLRIITVWADMVLPRYLWSHVDTYKVGVDTVSCSTMVKILSRELTSLDFLPEVPPTIIRYLNEIIRGYHRKEMNRNDAIHVVKAVLPEGYLQKRTVKTNYETLYAMHSDRIGHAMDGWEVILDWIERLPNMEILICQKI